MHSVVFGGFSPEALKGRIEDCASRVVITADEGVRGGKKIPLKANVDEAVSHVRGTNMQTRERPLVGDQHATPNEWRYVE